MIQNMMIHEKHAFERCHKGSRLMFQYSVPNICIELRKLAVLSSLCKLTKFKIMVQEMSKKITAWSHKTRRY